MPKVLNYYLDDSGSRHPDRSDIKSDKHKRDWFALGGILIAEEDEPAARSLVENFVGRWPQLQGRPLHSVELRHKTDSASWLCTVSESVQNKFFKELDQLTASLPVHGLACVIHRPGYNARYKEKYGHDRWQLCKTAFAIAVERATKHAVLQGMKLRVLVERCNKKVDNNTKAYFEALKKNGHPFDPVNSAQYSPITAQTFRETLHEFRLKNKSSSMMQIADLYLWPICMGGYHKSHKPYAHFCQHNKLLDHQYSESKEALGCKYSCFDGVEVRP
jgi:hypothetical protein